MKAFMVAVALMFGMSVAVANDKPAEKGKPAAEKKADTAKK